MKCRNCLHERWAHGSGTEKRCWAVNQRLLREYATPDRHVIETEEIGDCDCPEFK